MATKSSRKTTSTTRKFGKKRYTKVGCFKTKTAAKSAAKRLRASGKSARVVSTKSAKSCKNAVYSSSSSSTRRVRRKRSK